MKRPVSITGCLVVIVAISNARLPVRRFSLDNAPLPGLGYRVCYLSSFACVALISLPTGHAAVTCNGVGSFTPTEDKHGCVSPTNFVEIAWRSSEVAIAFGRFPNFMSL